MAADIPTSEPFEPERDERSQRERRAERHRARERADLPKRAMKTVVIGAIVVLAVAGAAWGLPKLADLGTDKCVMKNAHEHASFYVFDNMTRVRFNHPNFDLGGGANRNAYLPMKAHLHQDSAGEDWMLHLEYGCSTLGQFFGYLGADLKPGRFQLDQDLHERRVLQDDTNHTLSFYLWKPDRPNDKVNGNWTLFPDLHNHQMRQYEKALIVYGNYTEVELASLEAQVPAAAEGGSIRDTPATGTLATLAAASLALVVWRRRET